MPSICKRQTLQANVKADSAEDFYRLKVFTAFLGHAISELIRRFGKISFKKALRINKVLKGSE